ncbi:hypothetical protein [Georgenia sp. SUBG003]|uniref:hypothetical protein n=1 Tax=Georgenia sp. SUBG003 TaxID=1497974 RepID=UPI0004D6E11E|nr:hypothetical protein DA06_06890 [Georgenia sp. SUBG003]
MLTTGQMVRTTVLGIAITQGLFWTEYGLLSTVPIWLLVVNLVAAALVAWLYMRAARRKNAAEDLMEPHRPQVDGDQR